MRMLNKNYTLDCDQSNYSPRMKLGLIRNSAIWSADPENPNLEPNTRSESDDPSRRYRHFNFPLDLVKPEIAPFDPPTSKTPP